VELEAKDTLTATEESELFAIKSFPDNPRGQELAIKSNLDTITPKEAAELDMLQAREMESKDDEDEVDRDVESDNE